MDEQTRLMLSRAAQALKGMGASEVYVFGSAADGRLSEGSDVDLAVAGLPPPVFFRAMALVSGLLGRNLHLIRLEDDNPFTRYLRQEGELRRVA